MTEKKNPYTELERIQTTYLPTIDDVYNLLVGLGIECRLSGKYIRLDCPKCQRKNKVSVSYYEAEEKYTWRCWKTDCQCHQAVGGNLIGLVRITNNVDHEKALAMIGEILEPAPIPF